jgi:FAD/FMN-containing dehydrogenase
MPEQDLTALRVIAGDDGVLTDKADRRTYEVAARYDDGQAAAVVRPRTTAEVSSTIAYCVRQGISFVPQSGNTGLVAGSVPDQSGRQIILSLDRVRGTLAINPLDRTAVAGAGIRLSELNTAAAEHDLFLPIDLGADPMIGGMVATNTGGARFLRHGAMRDHVLRLVVVLPDANGTVLELSSGLRKDNTRLDLRQLFIGSVGALGIVTEATLDLARRPRQVAAALLVPTTPGVVLDLLHAVEGATGEFLTAFEGMSRPAMQAAFDHLPSLRNPFARGAVPDYAVLLELTTILPKEAVMLDTILERILETILLRAGSPLGDALFGDAQAIWALRHGLSEGLRACGQVIGFDLSFRRADMIRFREEAIAVLAGAFPECEVCDFGHIGDGGVHFNILVRGVRLAPSREAALRETILHIAVERYGGSFSAEHGIGRINQRDYDRFIPVATQHYSGAVAAVFADTNTGTVRYGPLQTLI